MNGHDPKARAPITRRGFIQRAGVFGIGLTLAQAGLLREAAAQSESIQDILDITTTVEAFGTTFLGLGLDSAKKGAFNKPWPPEVLAVVEAARAQEQFHFDFFQSAGGRPLTTTFTLPDPRLLTDFDLFFSTVVEQEIAEVAAQIAAIRAFTEQRRPDLVKISFQYAAEEAEHRVLANYTRGARPANNLAFAPALFDTVGAFLTSLRQRGIIGGTGPAASYPGPGVIDPSNVIERTPGGAAVSCTGTPLPDTGVDASPLLFPETGFSLGGDFLSYWRDNGGLAVFGYPIDSERQVDGRVVQWLERARFERHPQNAAPYNVQLGRLGVGALERQGRDWTSFAKADASAQHYFAETGHAIADPAFWRTWSGRGLEFDGQVGTSLAESLALFGYPISEPEMERNANGDQVLTQWFERARFEYHPTNPEPYTVLLGRLGTELR